MLQDYRSVRQRVAKGLPWRVERCARSYASVAPGGRVAGERGLGRPGTLAAVAPASAAVQASLPRPELA